MARQQPVPPATTTVDCPTCGHSVTWGADAPERPFCSRRCRLIDLGEWLDGSRAIPSEEAAGEALHLIDSGEHSGDE